MNTVTLIGRLGRDPEIRMTRNGLAVASLSVATSYLDSNRQERADWHNVVIYGDDANEVAQLKKGDKVIVVGQSRTRSWEDQQGQKRYVTEIVVSGINAAIGPALHAKSRQQAEQPATNQQTPTDNTYDDLNDEIPF